MTGMQYTDVLRDAYTLSGFSPQYRWTRALPCIRGIPLGEAAQIAARTAVGGGLLPPFLRELARSFAGAYTADAAAFSGAMLAAGEALRMHGAVLFPAALRQGATAQTISLWCAVCTRRMQPEKTPQAERVFLPWLCAVTARFVQ